MAHCPGLFRADLLAVLLARKPAAGDCCKAAGPHLDARRSRLLSADPAGLGHPAAQHRRRALSRRAAAVRRRDRLGAVAGLFSGLARCRRAQGDCSSRRSGPCSSSSRIIAGVAAWLFVLAQDSRRVAEEETRRQTDLLMNEIEAHKRTDAKLQKAKEVAEAASKAKSRHVVGLSHELRTPLNAILGYSQLLERDPALPPRRIDAVKVVRRSAEHLSGPDRRAARHLEDRSRPLSPRPQRGAYRRLPRPARRHVPPAGDGQGHRVPLRSRRSTCPRVVHTDENRLRQILINLLSNAIKFTDTGPTSPCRSTTATRSPSSTIEDTGVGIHKERPRAHLPAVRARAHGARQGDRRDRSRPDHHQAADQRHGRRPHGHERGRQGQLLPRQAAAVGGLASRASPRRRRIACAAMSGRARRSWSSTTTRSSATLVRELLTPLGFDVLTASTGRECLTLAEQQQAEPHPARYRHARDGWLARSRSGCARRRASAPPSSCCRPTPSIPSRLLEGERLHDDYLMKPIDLRQLLKKIHALLNIEWTYEPRRAVRPRRRAPRRPFAIASRRRHRRADRSRRDRARAADSREARARSRAVRRNCGDFVEQMRTIVNAFDLKRYARRAGGNP